MLEKDKKETEVIKIVIVQLHAVYYEQIPLYIFCILLYIFCILSHLLYTFCTYLI